MKVISEGSVRVDLLGGTLDLNPINLILENVVTLNVATSLKAKVVLEETDKAGVEIISLDYDSSYFFSEEDFSQDKLRGDTFGPMAFVAQILEHLDSTTHLKVTLQSGSPAGAGLGGSSAMGVTLYKALCEYKKIDLEPLDAIREVNHIEARILDSGPAGYQDYYPALFGGVLALRPEPGKVTAEQLFSQELKETLEKKVTLVYSGQTRLSGINNWEVYKKFFDKVPTTREGLKAISELSFKAYKAIVAKNYDALVSFIGREGAIRRELFPGIMSSSMAGLHEKILKDFPEVGLKVCGAGGGGCFLLTHEDGQREQMEEYINQAGMRILPFKIEPPLS